MSCLTLARLENATRKITNIEIYYKISRLTGHTLEELANDNQLVNSNLRKKLDNLLNNTSDDELEYIYDYVRSFIGFLNKRRSD